ncbi:telomere-protecting terminal protein Tpg [Streptomyces sp. NPDC086549]|uniref:telomere-protecting terminal protein Tpg n=1 Tax=Streptomyces sp. NPDC086549 TaxID=3365752 RepID=UPI003809CF4F
MVALGAADGLSDCSGRLRDAVQRHGDGRYRRPPPRPTRMPVRPPGPALKITRAVARLLGVSQRTVERYVKDQIRRPRADLAQRLANDVRVRWQPRVREQARSRAVTSTGLVIQTRAQVVSPPRPAPPTTPACVI